MKVEQQSPQPPIFIPITVTIETKDEFDALVAVSGYNISVCNSLDGRHIYTIGRDAADIPINKTLQSLFDKLCIAAGI